MVVCVLIFSVLIKDEGRNPVNCKDLWGPLLGESSRLARERLEARLSRLDVTPVQTHALLYLGDRGGAAAQAELTAFMHLKAPTVNGILDRMEEKELLMRTVDRRDGRRKLVVLTEKGKSLMEQLRCSFVETEEVMRRGFTEEETALFQTMLERLRENLKEDRDLC